MTPSVIILLAFRYVFKINLIHSPRNVPLVQFMIFHVYFHNEVNYDERNNQIDHNPQGKQSISKFLRFFFFGLPLYFYMLQVILCSSTQITHRTASASVSFLFPKALGWILSGTWSVRHSTLIISYSIHCLAIFRHLILLRATLAPILHLNIRVVFPLSLFV